MEQDKQDIERYFYHGDHLGSSSWVTDNSGVVNQCLAYMPFGEQLVDQRATGAAVRYTFSATQNMQRNPR